jgi:UDP-glucose:glycoprotein glucosyltransferase
LDNLAKESNVDIKRTHEQEYELSLKIGTEVIGEARADLLKLALSLRSYSPRVQVHQQIGEEYATECSYFADINGEIVCEVGKIESTLAAKKDERYALLDFLMN